MNLTRSDLVQAVDAAAKPLELAIVLPTLNERNNLAPLVDRLDAALQGIAWEAIIVDDNSPDGTSDEARAISLRDPRIRVIQRIGRRGLASAAIEGMCATAAPVVAVMDADHQHDPKLLPGMLQAITSGEYDLAYASRFCAGASTDAWHRPDRVKASGLANSLARRVTGVTLSDPMSGYFMLRAETLRADAHRLSGVGFKILLDILATVESPLRVKEFPLAFAARAEGESKLDRTVVFEFLVGLYDKWLGRVIPTRFALFGTIGAMGVVVHMAVLAAFLGIFGGMPMRGQLVSSFEVGQTVAAVTAMTFNFFLNNALTYADKRLTGFVPLVRGWAKFGMTCFVGLTANVGVAAILVHYGIHEYPAALTGIVIASVWNFALSSKFVWGKY
ncbi:glycosyltransferase [Novosphingobium album (ex Liu et al. 2023)]|uniref:Glycosyltransferase family 2 protein n=1 Tax=Novosphingobium album (ex Liu et al. 2023) TaxID=3031130 RepID=A0ABT5WTU9_9SPHN|nr:glycosyltransferase family 2 protein [Novosphingobium album (ex Liu et al. 2023)]MDE8653312.1 glycosyltransferase family 2 protein [Novosphingobium album (ex Liu et al. 2023)]